MRNLTGKAATLVNLHAAGFPVPEFLVSPPDLQEALARLGEPLAVRSSASVEDGGRASFAGQFRSYLNLRTHTELKEAVEACRVSVHSPSVAAYCRQCGVDPRSIRMDVIVQKMIEPRLAGVAFTVDPTSGEERVVIEACAGLADELLQGAKPALPKDHPLVRRFRPRIEALARRVQRHFGSPQDIEFAATDDEVYLLQARPITRISFAADVGEWTTADFRDGGVSSGVCSPLMWSLYEFVWSHTLKGFLREVGLWRGDFEAARMFFGRPYWNLGAVKECLAMLPGFVEREFDSDLGVAAMYEGDGRRTPLTLTGLLRAVPTVWAIRSFFRRQERFDRKFLLGGFERIEKSYDAARGDVAKSLRQLIERDYLLTESNYFRTIFAVSLAKLDFKQAFPNADYAELVAGLPPLEHMAPLHALKKLAARRERDIAGVLRTFRHHTVRGLDVRYPRWDEERSFVDQLLIDLLESSGHREPSDARDELQMRSGRSLSVPEVESRNADGTPWARVSPTLPRWKRRRFAVKLDRLRRLVWLREQMRDLSNRMYYHVRRHVLRIADEREIGDDIFFMTFPEIFTDQRSQVDHRRETYEGFRNFDAPGEIGARYPLRNEAASAVAIGAGLNEAGRNALVGIAASRGVARGVARVARTAHDAARIERGAILVCPFTDPGWTPVLDRVAGVVTEVGGLLSHAAVICREYGIPAVLGVPAATMRIVDGMEVTLDANAGCVHWMNTP